MDVGNLIKNARKKAVTPVFSAQKHPKLKWVLMESRLLEGEDILLVMEKCDLKEARTVYPDTTIYFPPEVDVLSAYRNDKELLHIVNIIKKRFNAWIVPHKCTKGKRKP